MTEKRVFTFEDDSWYDSGWGCDCCPSSWVEAYNCPDTDCNLGTAGSEEECYIQAIRTVLKNAPDEIVDELYGKSVDELKQMCDDLNVEVIIEGM